MRYWQRALGDAFMQAFYGKYNADFKQSCERLITKLEPFELNEEQKDLLEGMFMRIGLTLERSAQAIAEERTAL